MISLALLLMRHVAHGCRSHDLAWLWRTLFVFLRV